MAVHRAPKDHTSGGKKNNTLMSTQCAIDDITSESSPNQNELETNQNTRKVHWSPRNLNKPSREAHSDTMIRPPAMDNHPTAISKNSYDTERTITEPAQESPGDAGKPYQSPNTDKDPTDHHNTIMEKALIKEELTSWLIDNLGITDTRDLDEYTHTAMTSFLIQSTKDLELQFQPDEWNRKSEWTEVRRKMTPAKRSNHRPHPKRHLSPNVGAIDYNKKPPHSSNTSQSSDHTRTHLKTDKHLTQSLKDILQVQPVSKPPIQLKTVKDRSRIPDSKTPLMRNRPWEIISSNIPPTATAPEQKTRTQRPKSTTGNKSTLSPKIRSSMTMASNHIPNEDPNRQHEYPSTKRPTQIPWNKNTTNAEISTNLFIDPPLSNYPSAHPTPNIASKAQPNHAQMPLEIISPANPGKNFSVATTQSSPQPKPTTRKTPKTELNSPNVLTRASCNINPTATTTWYNPSEYETNKMNENIDRHTPKQINASKLVPTSEREATPRIPVLPQRAPGISTCTDNNASKNGNLKYQRVYQQPATAYNPAQVLTPQQNHPQKVYLHATTVSSNDTITTTTHPPLRDNTSATTSHPPLSGTTSATTSHKPLRDNTSAASNEIGNIFNDRLGNEPGLPVAEHDAYDTSADTTLLKQLTFDADQHEAHEISDRKHLETKPKRKLDEQLSDDTESSTDPKNPSRLRTIWTEAQNKVRFIATTIACPPNLADDKVRTHDRINTMFPSNKKNHQYSWHHANKPRVKPFAAPTGTQVIVSTTTSTTVGIANSFLSSQPGSPHKATKRLCYSLFDNYWKCTKNHRQRFKKNKISLTPKNVIPNTQAQAKHKKQTTLMNYSSILEHDTNEDALRPTRDELPVATRQRDIPQDCCGRNTATSKEVAAFNEQNKSTQNKVYRPSTKTPGKAFRSTNVDATVPNPMIQDDANPSSMHKSLAPHDAATSSMQKSLLPHIADNQGGKTPRTKMAEGTSLQKANNETTETLPSFEKVYPIQNKTPQRKQTRDARHNPKKHVEGGLKTLFDASSTAHSGIKMDSLPHRMQTMKFSLGEQTIVQATPRLRIQTHRTETKEARPCEHPIAQANQQLEIPTHYMETKASGQGEHPLALTAYRLKVRTHHKEPKTSSPSEPAQTMERMEVQKSSAKNGSNISDDASRPKGIEASRTPPATDSATPHSTTTPSIVVYTEKEHTTTVCSTGPSPDNLHSTQYSPEQLKAISSDVHPSSEIVRG